jgi:hypothetical protein
MSQVRNNNKKRINPIQTNEKKNAHAIFPETENSKTQACSLQSLPS